MAILVFVSKMTDVTVGSASRLFTPYYGYIIAVLVVYIHDRAIRGCWFKMLAYLSFMVAGLLTIMSPGHPLWPVKSFLANNKDNNSRLVKRMETVYSAYLSRYDAFRPLVDLLPSDANVVGMVQFDQIETSVWRPFGTRRVFHVTQEDTTETVRTRGIKYILVGEPFLQDNKTTSDDWAQKMGGKVIARQVLLLRAAVGPVVWYVVQLNAD